METKKNITIEEANKVLDQIGKKAIVEISREAFEEVKKVFRQHNPNEYTSLRDTVLDLCYSLSEKKIPHGD